MFMKKILFILICLFCFSTVNAKRVELTLNFDYNDTFNIVNEFINKTPLAEYLIVNGLNLSDELSNYFNIGKEYNIAINSVADNWLLNFCSDNITTDCIKVPENAKYMFIGYSFPNNYLAITSISSFLPPSTFYGRKY